MSIILKGIDMGVGVYIPNMEKPKSCGECRFESTQYVNNYCRRTFCNLGADYEHCPLIEIDLVRCGECKHRPIKDDPDGENYGFNIIEPTDGDDICPCLVDDGWYSWMPEDNFCCGRGERRADEHKR